MSKHEDEITKAPEVTHQEFVESPAVASGTTATGRSKKKYRAQDDAIDILADVGGYVEYTIDEDKSVLRKIDIRVCIPMFLIYSLVHLDKSALSYGAVFSLQKETHLEGAQYSWLTSIIYLVQLVVQPISAYALVRLPLAKWVIFNVFCWGVCVMCMAAAHDFTGLMVTRALMGGFEATVSPAFIACVQIWWRRREQTWRNTFWLLSSSVAGMIGPLVAFGVGHIHSGIKPYQGIFIFLGGITLVLVPILWWMYPDDVKTAKFLSPREKAIAVERLRSNNTGTKTQEWKWYQVKETFTDPKTYLWGMMLLVTAIPSSGIGAFGGLITKGFGFDSFTAILFQIPMNFLHGPVLVIGAWVTNRWRLRFPVIAVITLFPIGGAIALIYIDRSKTGALLVAYYMIALYSAIQPLLLSWANSNAAGTTKQRVLGGVLFVFQCAGNVAGPQVYLDEEKPTYHTGLYTNVGCWALLVILCCVMGVYLNYLNKQQEKKRAERGEIVQRQDTSIMTTAEEAAYKKQLDIQAEGVNQHAYEDKTDKENPEFIYVI